VPYIIKASDADKLWGIHYQGGVYEKEQEAVNGVLVSKEIHWSLLLELCWWKSRTL